MRGGRRPGAGRKPKMSLLKRIGIGGRCEREWRGLIAKRLDAKARAESPEYFEEVQRAREVPVSERRRWLEENGELHSYDVDAALRADQGTGDDPPSRYMRVTVKRPKGGERRAIIKKIAAETGLSESAVDRCWKEFRAVEKDLRDDDV